MSLNKRIISIRNEILKSKNPILFFDTDADGTTSYFQLKNAFPNLKGFYMKKEGQDKMLELIEEKNDLIIFFDIPFLDENLIRGIKDKKIIWADHHLSNSLELIKKYKIIHLNPLNYDKTDNRPSSYLAYKVANLKKNLPLAVLGSVSDFFILNIIIELYEFDQKIFKLLFKICDEKRLELFDFLKKYKFNDINQNKTKEYWIRYLTYECGFIEFKNLFDLLFKLEKVDGDDSILKSINLIEKMSIFDLKVNMAAGKGFLFEDLYLMNKKYKKIINKILKKKNIENEFILFEYSGKNSFTRQIAEELTYKFKDFKVIAIIFMKIGKDSYSGSFRGNNYDVNSLVVNSIEGLNGNGGGHKFAAGCLVPKENYSVFKKRILEEFEKNKKN